MSMWPTWAEAADTNGNAIRAARTRVRDKVLPRGWTGRARDAHAKLLTSLRRSKRSGSPRSDAVQWQRFEARAIRPERAPRAPPERGERGSEEPEKDAPASREPAGRVVARGGVDARWRRNTRWRRTPATRLAELACRAGFLLGLPPGVILPGGLPLQGFAR